MTSAVLLFYAEKDSNDAEWTFVDNCFWWGLMTLTTGKYVNITMTALGFLIHGFQNNFTMRNVTKEDRIRQVLGPIISKTLKNPWVPEPLSENPWVPRNPWNPC